MTEKILQSKRKQHYVWANYLKRWSPDNGCNIYYKTSKGKIIRGSVRGIAVEIDFYKAANLTDEQVVVIRHFINGMNENSQKTHSRLLNNILEIFHLQSLYVWGGEQDKEASMLFEAAKCNMIENLHGRHEVAVNGVMKELSKRNLGVLNCDTNMSYFMSFLGIQLFRTKKIKERCLEASPCDTKLEKLVTSTMRSFWWFFSYFFGINFGENLFLSRDISLHALLINDTDIPFITSDQPVINVHEHVNDFVDLYYPISPKIAYWIGESRRFPSGKVNIGKIEAEQLNAKMVEKSYIHIFGNSEESIRSAIGKLSFSGVNRLL
jgi:hypothetical protein